jgi:hypothetical protein
MPYGSLFPGFPLDFTLKIFQKSHFNWSPPSGKVGLYPLSGDALTLALLGGNLTIS